MRAVLRMTLVRHLAGTAIGLLALYLLTSHVTDYRNTQIATVAYYLCAVAGLTVLTGLSGQISLGQGAFMAIGGYVAILMQIHVDVPLGVLLLCSLLAGAVGGVIVGIAAARLRGPYLAGATLALAVGLPALADYGKLTSTLGGEAGLQGNPPPTPPTRLGINFPQPRWAAWLACLCAVFVLLALSNLMRSRVGRNWQAVRDDEIAAQLCGLQVSRVQLLAFVVSSACAGLGGGVLAVVINGSVTPGAFSLTLSLGILTAIVIGGLGSLAGAVYGAIIIAYLPTWIADITPSTLSAQVQDNIPSVVYGALLILVMLVFPLGLQGGLRAVVGASRRLASRSGSETRRS